LAKIRFARKFLLINSLNRLQEQQPQLPGQDGWNQVQQKALEAALQQFPKGTAERWERISSKVSGKSKEECMLRVRYLAEFIKKKKESS
jgi:DnaJ family protein C protein 1